MYIKIKREKAPFPQCLKMQTAIEVFIEEK